MKRTQQAVPAILFLFLGLFLFYIIMMTPQESEVFFGNATSNQSSGSQKISAQIGLVGGATGQEVIGTRDFTDVFVAYPSERTLRYHENQLVLSSNILYSDSRYYDLEAGENTKSLLIHMDLGDMTNGPVLGVFVNGVQVGSTSSGGELNISIGADSLNESNRVIVACQFQGWAFWSQEACSINSLDIYIENYEAKDSNFIRSFDITTKEAYSSFLSLNFSIGENTNEGDLLIKFNGEELYRGRPVEGIYNVEKEIPPEQNNEIFVQAETGGIYEIKKMTLGFKTGMIAEKMPVVNFDLSNTNSDITINVYVKEIILGPSILNLRMESAGVTYQMNPIRTGWNEITIRKEHLRTKNSIELVANGLLDVGSVEIG
jgi:hypothetical protein